jgi:hypothetical protein
VAIQRTESKSLARQKPERKIALPTMTGSVTSTGITIA